MKVKQKDSLYKYKPLKMVILEIFFSYKVYFYIGFALSLIPFIVFPYLYLLINTEFFRTTTINLEFLGIHQNPSLFRVIIVIFIVSSMAVIVPYWVFLLIHDTPIVRGAIIMTLLELLVLIHGRVYFQMKWKDINKIGLTKTAILYKGIHKKGYKLVFYGPNTFQVLNLWCFSISKKKVKKLIGTIREISRVNKIILVEPSFIDKIEPVIALEEFDKIRYFKKGY